MKISPETLVAQAEATGFRPDMLEKVALLPQLLDAVRIHPFLKDELVLKGRHGPEPLHLCRSPLLK